MRLDSFPSLHRFSDTQTEERRPSVIVVYRKHLIVEQYGTGITSKFPNLIKALSIATRKHTTC